MDMIQNAIKAPESRVIVVRLCTSAWKDKRGLHFKKSLRFLRSKSVRMGLLEDDADAIGVDNVFNRIVNLLECDDGVYEVIICNEKHDRETGETDDYDYKLVPYKESREQNATPAGLPG